MKLLNWFKKLLSPEIEHIEPFPGLVKEKTTEVLIKPTPTKPRKTTKKKSTGGKKNG